MSIFAKYAKAATPAAVSHQAELTCNVLNCFHPFSCFDGPHRRGVKSRVVATYLEVVATSQKPATSANPTYIDVIVMSIMPWCAVANGSKTALAPPYDAGSLWLFKQNPKAFQKLRGSTWLLCRTHSFIKCLLVRCGSAWAISYLAGDNSGSDLVQRR